MMITILHLFLNLIGNKLVLCSSWGMQKKSPEYPALASPYSQMRSNRTIPIVKASWLSIAPMKCTVYQEKNPTILCNKNGKPCSCLLDRQYLDNRTYVVLNISILNVLTYSKIYSKSISYKQEKQWSYSHFPF